MMNDDDDDGCAWRDRWNGNGIDTHKRMYIQSSMIPIM